MCFDDQDGDPCTVWHPSIRVARKQYRCCECRGPIPVGARHEYLFTVHDGSAGGDRTHLECAALWEFAIHELCGGVGGRLVGGLGEEIGEYSHPVLDDDGNEVPGPTLREIWDCVRDGYEREAATSRRETGGGDT